MRRLLFAAAAAAVLVCAPSALAAADPGKFYLGGNLSPGTAPKAITGSVLVQVVTSADATLSETYLEGSLQCGRSVMAARLPIAPDGAFTGSGTDSDTRVGVRYTSVYSFSGRFDGRSASGTAHIDLSYKFRGRTRKCSRDFTFTLRQAPTGDEQFTPGPPRPATQYFGGVGNGQPFVLRTDATGANIAMAAFTFTLKCRRDKRESNEFTPKIKVRPDRTFTLTERWTERYSDGIEKFTVTVKGVFVEGSVAGDAKVTTVFRNKRKRVTDRCSTPKMAFFATV